MKFNMLFLFFFIELCRSQTVQNIQLEKYMGLWYQVYTNYFVAYSFERGGSCITAKYEILGDGTVGVENQMKLFNQNVKIVGIGVIHEPSEPGKIDVHFDYGGDGEYWIYKLGPVYNGSYEYSVVSDSRKLSLFILARDIERFNKFYNTQVISFLDNNNFSQIILTNNSNCTFT